MPRGCRRSSGGPSDVQHSRESPRRGLDRRHPAGRLRFWLHQLHTRRSGRHDAIGGDQVKTRTQSLLNADYVTVNNGVWALPYEYDPFGYVYNASLFKDAGLDPDKPPQTWAELRATNTTLKSKNPNVWPICQPIKNLAKTLPIIWNAGGDIWDRDVL